MNVTCDCDSPTQPEHHSYTRVCMHSQKAIERDGLCSRDIAIIDREPACFVIYMLQRAEDIHNVRA